VKTYTVSKTANHDAFIPNSRHLISSHTWAGAGIWWGWAGGL